MKIYKRLEILFAVIGLILTVSDYLLVPKSYYEMVPENPDEISKFRSESTINTFTVIGSVKEEDITKNHIEFGPRRSQISLLNE